MHYRRMDPQPPARLLRFLGVSRYVFCALEERTGGTPVWADGENTCVTAPDDMQGAVPFRARDGEWYWRRSVERAEVRS